MQRVANRVWMSQGTLPLAMPASTTVLGPLELAELPGVPPLPLLAELCPPAAESAVPPDAPPFDMIPPPPFPLSVPLESAEPPFSELPEFPPPPEASLVAFDPPATDELPLAEVEPPLPDLEAELPPVELGRG